MADTKLHIIITGETGPGRSLLVGRHFFRNTVLSLLLILVLLGAGTVTGFRQQRQNIDLRRQVARLTRDLHEQTSVLRAQLARETGDLRQALKQTRKQLAVSRREKEKIIARFEDQVAALKREKQELLTGSISRLDERSRIIKTLMEEIGVKIEVEEDPGHSGGAFIAPDPANCDRLLVKTDRYLAILKQLPLGRPIQTKISSRYGRRKDPINGRQAFHAGIDFKGRTGDPVKATGSGVVKRASRNKGLGNYVIIDHGNGYETVYGHMKKRLVKRGQRVVRGQTIGLVGNTGRSTGSHLHYEVRQGNRTVDPMKFLQIAALMAKK